MSNRLLKQNGIYRLPDGTEIVVGAGREGRYFLYFPLLWRGRTLILNLPVAYEVNREGHVLTGAGHTTQWRVDDLHDTGNTA